jgi:uncharacterized protein (TIGR02600 family)
MVGGSYGRLTPGVTSYSNPGIYRQPDVPVGVGTAGVLHASGGIGDWDSGFGDQKDGAHINKPDEGDTIFTDNQGGKGFRLPYALGYAQGHSAATNVFFSPNRQIPSPMMFGSLPTGIQRRLPWQTLLFHPRPEDPSHPGKSSPPDHLLADLFWMPVVEPYAISQPFSTAGKINMNYQIQPFSYIKRSTGVRAVLESTRFLALPESDVRTYKPIDPGNFAARAPDRRVSVDAGATLAQFEQKFAGGGIFRSATEICEINLVPPGQTAASMAAFWLSYRLSGDNVREKPYVDIYPRLTTKSNSFTVHFRVQALQKARSTPPGQWKDGADRVVTDYRGSASVERYIDPTDQTLPDFASLAVSQPSSPSLNLDRYYRMRVVSRKRFAP